MKKNGTSRYQFSIRFLLLTYLSSQSLLKLQIINGPIITTVYKIIEVRLNFNNIEKGPTRNNKMAHK